MFDYFEYDKTVRVDSLPFVNAPVTDGDANEEATAPAEILDDYEAMDAIRSDQKKAVRILEDYIRKYPGNPVLLCWLSYSYNRIGQKRRSQELLKENDALNPTHLFVRFDYAVYQIKYHKNHQIVPLLCNNTFNLDELYPERKVFHTAEISAFYHALGLYFVCMGDLKTAALLVDTLKDIDLENSEAVEDIEFALRAAKIKQMMRG